MNKIKFSHDYPKLWRQTEAFLLDVRIINKSDMHIDLLEYDTRTCNGDYYPLPKGTYIQLTFRGNKGIPFCTIRPYNAQKYQYYFNLIGKLFNIIIN